MLTHLSHDDIQHLQTVGKDAQEARSKFILHDDQEKVWTHLTSVRQETSRIDFVLDNGPWLVIVVTSICFNAHECPQLDLR